MQPKDALFAFSARSSEIAPDIRIAGRFAASAAFQAARDAGFEALVALLPANGSASFLPDGVQAAYCEGEPGLKSDLSIALGRKQGLEGAVVLSIEKPLLPALALRALASASSNGKGAACIGPDGAPAALGAAGGFPPSFAPLGLVFGSGAYASLSTEEGRLAASSYAKAHSGMEREQALALLKECGTPRHIVLHCLAVAEKAKSLAARASAKGLCLDSCLIETASLLHDCLRLERRHEEAGRRLLFSKGYYAVSDAVGRHMGSSGAPRMDEADIVYLADKLVEEDREVSIEERYLHALRKFSGDPAVISNIRRNMAYAEAVFSRLNA